MKGWLFLLAGFLFVLNGSPLLDLSNAGIPLGSGDGKSVVISKEEGKALHTTKFWQKSTRLHRKIHRGHAAYKHTQIINTPDGVKLVTAKEFAKVTFEDGVKSNISSRFFHRMLIKPEHKGKKLVASFKIRGKFYPGYASNYIYCGIVFNMDKNKAPVSNLGRRAMPRGTEVMSFTAPVPEGAKSADFHMALYGCGEMEVLSAELKVSSESNAMSPDVLVATSGYTDCQFFLPSKHSFPMKFIYRREFTYKPKTAKLFVELPQGFKCTGHGLQMRRLKDENGVIVFNTTSTYLKTIIRDTFCNWTENSILIYADTPPADKFYTMRYWLETDGKRSTPRTLALKVIPFEEHTAPAVLKSGLHYTGFNATYFDSPGSESFVKMYKNCGFNYISARIFPEFAAALKKAGIERSGNAMPMRNGYRVYATVPQEESFLDIQGKPIHRVFCPAAVYNRMPTYRKEVMEFSKRHLGPNGLYDHAGGNWEPYMYDYKGCFCRRCGEEFARYAKLEWKEVEKIWPAQVIKKYREKWCAFRSWQHGKVVTTVKEDVEKAGRTDKGKKSHFIPDISYYAFTNTMSDSYTAQYHARDYLHKLERLCIWGPYAHKAGLHEKYRYTPAQHLPHLLVCAKVNEFVRKYSKATIKGLPQGCHVHWVTTPEAIVFETLSGFVYGHSMSVPFWFCYDYRAYREMARMNSLLAKVEPWLLKGRESKEVKGTPVTPFLESRHWRAAYEGTSLQSVVPELMNVSALQLRRLDHEGKTLIAAANVWEKGNVFFKLTLPDYKGKAPLVITNVQSYESLRVTGEELQKGIELQLKELQWAFFLVEPFDKNKNYAMITKQQIAERKKALLPAITKAWEEENALLKASGPAQIASFDFSAIPEVRSGDIVCRPVKGARNGEVEVVTPLCRFEFEPAVHGRIKSWTVGKTELVAPSEHFGFGVSGCWMPHRRHLRGKFTVTNVKSVNDKLLVELLMPPDRHNPFEVRSRYFFDNRGFRQELSVTNRGRMPSNIMLRFHIFSSLISGGSVTAGGKALPILPKVVYFRNGLKNGDAEFPLRAEESFDVPHSCYTFSKKGIPFNLEFSADNLLGVVMWNNPGHTLASFEPTFAPVQGVKPGEQVNAAQSWHIIKK